MMHRRPTLLALLGALVLGGSFGCAHPAPPVEVPPLEEPPPEPDSTASADDEMPPAVRREAPPPSGPARDITMPEVHRFTLRNGLEVNFIEWHSLPVTYSRLVVRGGRYADPDDKPGLSGLVASMLKEGTRRRSSAELAEAIEFLGADLWTGSGADELEVGIRAVNENIREALGILAEVVTQPAFATDEWESLREREKARLEQTLRNPFFLAQREFYGRLYADSPYARIETTEAVLDTVGRRDFQAWHRRFFVPSNSYLVIAGDLTPDQARAEAERAFRSFRGRAAPALPAAPTPSTSAREVVIVDRPESVQSVILIGNEGVPRSSPDWVNLTVANQVLGGSSSSRLFMDLRERRSLTYGAYSVLTRRVRPGAFISYAQVRTDVTQQAMSAFFEHLDRIVAEAPPEEEVDAARRYLSNSFPLQLGTPNDLAGLVSDLRLFGLPDNYWDDFRSRIAAVSPADAHAAARTHIHPDRALIVIVGQASAFAEGLASYGPVTVVDVNGNVTRRIEAGATESDGEG